MATSLECRQTTLKPSPFFLKEKSKHNPSLAWKDETDRPAREQEKLGCFDASEGGADRKFVEHLC